LGEETPQRGVRRELDLVGIEPNAASIDVGAASTMLNAFGIGPRADTRDLGGSWYERLVTPPLQLTLPKNRRGRSRMRQPEPSWKRQRWVC